jgi:hypothetical protein
VKDLVDPELSREFKNDPTIENWVKLRRAHPSKEIETAIVGGIDAVFAM